MRKLMRMVVNTSLSVDTSRGSIVFESGDHSKSITSCASDYVLDFEILCTLLVLCNTVSFLWRVVMSGRTVMLIGRATENQLNHV